MDFSTPNQPRDIEVHTLFLTLNSMKVATIYLLNEILGRNLCNLHSSGRKAQVSSLSKQRGVTDINDEPTNNLEESLTPDTTLPPQHVVLAHVPQGMSISWVLLDSCS